MSLQLLNRFDAGASDEMHLEIEELGDVNYFVVVDAEGLVDATKIIQNADLREANIDALQGAHVADVL